MSFLTDYFEITEASGEVPVCCPFPHQTSSGAVYYEARPSAHVNTNENLFHCKVCGEGFSEAQFIMKILGCDYATSLKLQRCFDNTEDILEWRESTQLSEASKVRANKLGISDNTLSELEVRTPDLTTDLLAFPAFMFGHLVDVRTYNPGHTPKIRSRANCPSGVIIPFDIWRNSDKNRWTLICAGEKDMAIARSNGFNAITITGGESKLPASPEFFRGRSIAICYDNDGAGIYGAKRLAQYLSQYTPYIKVVTGFHEICKEKGEDITDFFTKYNKTAKDLIDILEATSIYKPEDDPELQNRFPVMNLLEASKASNVNKMVKSNIQVVSVSEETFVCPSAVVAEKFQQGQNDSMAVGEIREWTLNDNTLQDILHLMDNNFKEDAIKEHLRNLMKIMQKEKYVSIKTLKRVTVFKACVTDLFETSDTVSALPMEYTIYSIGKKLESGQKYMVTHKLVPHPYKGQQLVSIATDYKQANDSVSDFKITDEAIKNLKVIQELKGTVPERINSLVQKVKGILGYNGNDQLITTIDLAFNTVLQFNFGSFKNVRGYLDTFLISESRLGKSSTADALRKTYGLGAITSLAGNSATIPGLVGGSNKTTGGYQTRAGVIPQNHKGLIIFEEFGKSSHQISAELTDIRSSNEVRIARVSGTMTLPALVRMITLTNPKTTSGQIKSIASYPNGFSVLTELVETAEDIARYDLIVILSDRGNKAIDPFWVPEEPLPQEVYRTRIRWIWSRTPEQIQFDQDVPNYIIKSANDINDLYDCHIKIFGTECWKKITRLAIAVAGYLVSTDDTYENIVVKREHVDYAIQFLLDLYDNPTFKLREYVTHEKKYTEIDEEGIANLQGIYDKSPMLILQLEQAATTTKNILQAATGMSHDDLNKALNALTKGLFIKFSNYDIVPTERFRKGVAEINKKSFLPKIGEY